jgi:hypothetical protein
MHSASIQRYRKKSNVFQSADQVAQRSVSFSQPIFLHNFRPEILFLLLQCERPLSRRSHIRCPVARAHPLLLWSVTVHKWLSKVALCYLLWVSVPNGASVFVALVAAVRKIVHSGAGTTIISVLHHHSVYSACAGTSA